MRCRRQGFGGQQNYFGLFVSDSYTDGHSKGHPLSTTYSSVVLSKEQEFKVAEMEIWRTGPRPGAGDDGDDDDGSGGKSILDGPLACPCNSTLTSARPFGLSRFWLISAVATSQPCLQSVPLQRQSLAAAIRHHDEYRLQSEPWGVVTVPYI